MYKYIKVNLLLIVVYWICSLLILSIDSGFRFVVYFFIEVCLIPLLVCRENLRIAKKSSTKFFIEGFIGIIIVILVGHTLSYFIISKYYYNNDLSLPVEIYWFKALNFLALFIGFIGSVVAQIVLWRSMSK